MATFADVQFNGPIFFGPATFKSKPPEFFQTKLHQDTDFHQVKWPPGPKKSRDATQFVRAFECLKLEMDRPKRHEDELTFFAFELKGRRALEGQWKALLIALYGCLCDYGRSSFRPLLGLVITIVVGALLFLPHFGMAEYEKAFGISFANAFAILGYRKDFVGVETIGKLSNLLIAVSSIETVVGAVLLFLFGLALRNGFRMR